MAPSELAGADALTALERAQAELNGLYCELERLNRLASLGTIASMIAHEFNNILTPVLSYAQMAAAKPEDGELVEKALSRTISGSERAARIAQAILSFARDGAAGGSASAFHVEQQGGTGRCNVLKVVNESLACLARDPARDGVQLKIDVPTMLEVPMAAPALQQVLVNLILNARNAMPSGRGELSIVASACGDEFMTVRQVIITIRDTGCGIPPERLAQLFTPFATHATGTHRGTGLGLVITKRLV